MILKYFCDLSKHAKAAVIEHERKAMQEYSWKIVFEDTLQPVFDDFCEAFQVKAKLNKDDDTFSVSGIQIMTDKGYDNKRASELKGYALIARLKFARRSPYCSSFDSFDNVCDEAIWRNMVKFTLDEDLAFSCGWSFLDFIIASFADYVQALQYEYNREAEDDMVADVIETYFGERLYLDNGSGYAEIHRFSQES
ncbi:MAG: hypothetical protein K5854_01690 [Prevotella sp.]|nr:hypothetical protein [Prevotella sp.]